MITRRELLLTTASGALTLSHVSSNEVQGTANIVSQYRQTDGSDTDAEGTDILRIGSGEDHIIPSESAETYDGVVFETDARLQLEETSAIRLTDRASDTVCAASVVAEQHGTSTRIGLQDIQQAINWWAAEDPLPEINEILGLRQIQELINKWATDQTIDCE